MSYNLRTRTKNIVEYSTPILNNNSPGLLNLFEYIKEIYSQQVDDKPDSLFWWDNDYLGTFGSTEESFSLPIAQVNFIIDNLKKMSVEEFRTLKFIGYTKKEVIEDLVTVVDVADKNDGLVYFDWF